MSKPSANSLKWPTTHDGQSRQRISGLVARGVGNRNEEMSLRAAKKARGHMGSAKCQTLAPQAQASIHFPKGINRKKRGERGIKDACIHATPRALSEIRRSCWADKLAGNQYLRSSATQSGHRTTSDLLGSRWPPYPQSPWSGIGRRSGYSRQSRRRPVTLD